MKVRFKKTDPRGGTVVELPDDQAQAFIDDGTATKVADDTETNGYGQGAEEATGTEAPSGRKADTRTTATKDASTRSGTSNKAAGGDGTGGTT